MNKKILLVSSHFPPIRSGMSDYTSKINKYLANDFNVDLYTPQNKNGNWDSSIVFELFFLLRKKNYRSVLIQYVPYMYGRRGVCPFFILLLLWIKVFSTQKIVINIHEVHYPNLGTLKSLVLSSIHKFQIWMIGKTCDALTTTTNRFKKEIEEITSREVHHISVGSNIEKSSRVNKDFVTGFILFGGFHMSKMFDEIYKKLLKLEANFIHIGMSKENVPLELQEHISDNVTFTGTIEEEDVSAILNTGLPLLAPFIDGTSTRRGTMMAGLLHGNHVISTQTDLTDNELLNLDGLTLYPVDKYIEMVKDNLETLLVSRGEKSNHEQFSWPSIVDKFKKYL